MTKQQKTARKKQLTMKRIANETSGQRAKRLGPTRRIVRFKKNASKVSQVAILECGHHHTTDLSKRKTMRCRQCRDGKKASKKTTLKKAA